MPLDLVTLSRICFCVYIFMFSYCHDVLCGSFVSLWFLGLCVEFIWCSSSEFFQAINLNLLFNFYCQFCIQWQIWEVFCSLYHTLKFHFCNSSFDLFNLHSYLLSISWRLVQIKHKCLQLNIFLLMERMELSQE